MRASDLRGPLGRAFYDTSRSPLADLRDDRRSLKVQRSVRERSTFSIVLLELVDQAYREQVQAILRNDVGQLQQ